MVVTDEEISEQAVGLTECRYEIDAGLRVCCVTSTTSGPNGSDRMARLPCPQSTAGSDRVCDPGFAGSPAHRLNFLEQQGG